MYMYANNDDLDIGLQKCFSSSNKDGVVMSRNVEYTTDQENFGAADQLASMLVNRNCNKPVWHSGGFIRWKQLLKLNFGNYYCRMDSAGYLRIHKGRKVVL